MATANVMLSVRGQEVAAALWEFYVIVNVYDFQLKEWRRSKAGEAEVRLIEEHWGILPDKLLDTKVTGSNGDVRFGSGGQYPAGRYKVEAEHLTSHHASGVVGDATEAGQWSIINIYEP